MPAEPLHLSLDGLQIEEFEFTADTDQVLEFMGTAYATTELGASLLSSCSSCSCCVSCCCCCS